MSQKKLEQHLSQTEDFTNDQANTALNTILDKLVGDLQTLEVGKTYRLLPLGTFSVTQRKARKGRNPQTGAAIDIPAKKVLKFKPSSKISEFLADR